MIEMTQSFSHWCWENHRDIFGLVALGHVELITDEIWGEYIEWCKTEEGAKYLKGGSEYKEEDQSASEDHPTSEEAITILEECECLDADVEGALDMAIEALKKQIPAKPIGDLHSVPHYRCPACKGGVVLYDGDGKNPFCHFCGQAIDWSDLE